MRSLYTMIDRWQSEGLVLLPPEPESRVRQAFSSVGSAPTSDVIAMFAAFGGMQDCDQELWRLWSLAEIQDENRKDSSSSLWYSDYASSGVWFSDYAVCAWCYRLVPNEDSTSSVFAEFASNVPSKKVANSLAEFFSIYVENPYQVLEGPHPTKAKDDA